MNIQKAIEVAFTNGYRKGKSDAIHEMRHEIKARCLKKGIFPAVVDRVIYEVVEEMMLEANK
jgi:hypothetical protein